MGMHNILQASMTCPHCGSVVYVEIEMRFGDTRNLDTFRMGDSYKWISGQTTQRGGRPLKGNLDGEGYTECPQCRRDFFVIVTIRADRIERVEPDREKAGYLQQTDIASMIPESDATSTLSGAPIWKPKPGARETGQIAFNEKWDLTPRIEQLLGQLVQLGVDISSTMGGDDYTLLVPLDLSREQQDEAESIMKQLGVEVKGTVKYVDWYPHGWKFRIEPRKGNPD